MLSDFRFALRQLLKSPGFSSIALLTLALGIALNTSMFSLMNMLVLQPLPFPDRDQLVRIYRTTPQTQTGDHTGPDTIELTREMSSFADVAAFRMWGYTLTPEGRPPVNLNALRVTASFFPTLGLKPEVGRFFTAEEDQPGNHVIILSYATWQAHFGGDPGIVGQNVRIDGVSTTVVGVMPAAFSSVFLWGPGDAFRPLGMLDTEKVDHGSTPFQMFARKHSDISLEQFNTRLATLSERLAALRPKERSKDGLRAVTLQSTVRSPAAIGISSMLVSLAGFVLLIACANLANLQLARAIARAHEFAVRAALGASRMRLLRPLLAESLLLAAAGGLIGVVIATWINDWVAGRLSENGFVTFVVSIDWRVVAFAIVVSAFAGIFFGLAPAWLISRVKVNETLKSGSRGNTGDRAQHRVRNSLIVGQFSLALILLAGSGFFLRGVKYITGIDPGWDRHSLVGAVLNLPTTKYPSPAVTYAFYQRLQERLGALPGVQNVSVSWTLPLYLYLTSRPLVAEGHEPPQAGHEPVASVNGVAPSYLDTLKIKLKSGRNFTEADNLTSLPVVIINESMARALFPNEDPVGRRIGSPDPKNPNWYEIVGVVPDTKFAVASGAPGPKTPFLVLRPLAQETWNYVTVAVRGSNAENLTEPVRQAIAALDPDLAVQQLSTVDQAVKKALGPMYMMNTILVTFGLLGLLLSAIGLYGVIARIVVQRTAEIGVRVALGAQAGDVVWLVLSSGLRLILWGAGIGLLGAFALGFILSRITQNGH
ncbi:MAG TPA: ABC transporter permease, partial [Candidatus Didemnitutus sp.]|nr:ABC transporter permease [Candidatus Didemnitutus sp.]